MPDKFKEVTVGDIIDAMERNGFRQARGAWVVLNQDGSVRRACAMGQAAINLGIDYEGMGKKLNDVTRPNIYVEGLSNIIMELNDEIGLSCKAIAEKVRIKYAKKLNKKIKFRIREYKIREKKSV